MGARLGDRVIYTLSRADADAVNRRREDYAAFQRKATRAVQGESGRNGHRAHVGNHVAEGMACPAVIVRVFDPNSSTANLQVLLDGNDELWATSVREGTRPGTYRHDAVFDRDDQFGPDAGEG